MVYFLILKGAFDTIVILVANFLSLDSSNSKINLLTNLTISRNVSLSNYLQKKQKHLTECAIRFHIRN